VKDNKPVLTEDLDVAGAVVVVSQLGQRIQLLACLPAQQVLEVGFVKYITVWVCEMKAGHRKLT